MNFLMSSLAFSISNLNPNFTNKTLHISNNSGARNTTLNIPFTILLISMAIENINAKKENNAKPKLNF